MLSRCLASTGRCPAALCAAAAAIALGGCVTETEVQSFRVPEDSAVGSAQVAVDADFSRYDRLLVDDMGIFFPSSVTLDEADQARLRGSFRQAFVDELGGYRIVQVPGPTTMQVSASLVDFRFASGADMLALEPRVREITEPGSLVFLMELKDSQSGRILGRAADSARAPSFATERGTETDWRAVEEAAAYWARLFRQFLERSFGEAATG